MELSFTVNKPFDTVFKYLSDMQKFVSIHPVISKIDPRPDNTYLVHETLKFGFIPFSFTYPVTVAPDEKNKCIVMRATVMRLTKIHMIFSLSTENGITTINETIGIKTLLPVKGMMQKIFREQHTKLFKNMEQNAVAL